MPKRNRVSFVWQQPMTPSAPEPKRRRDTRETHKHTRDEWFKHRKKIENLYQHHDLLKVVSIMAEEDGFHASEAQFKHHLEGWGSWKYVTLSVEQTEFIKEKAMERLAQGKSRLAVRWNGKKIASRKLSKLLQKILGSLYITDPIAVPTSEIASSTGIESSVSSSSPMRKMLNASLEDGSSQDTRTTYLVSRTSTTSCPAAEGDNKPLGELSLLGATCSQKRSEQLTRFDQALGGHLVPHYKPSKPSNAKSSSQGHTRGASYAGLSVYTSSTRGATIPADKERASLAASKASPASATDANDVNDASRGSIAEPATWSVSKRGFPFLDMRSRSEAFSKVVRELSSNFEKIRYYQARAMEIDRFNLSFVRRCRQLNCESENDLQALLPDLLAHLPENFTLAQAVKAIGARMLVMNAKRECLIEIEKLHHLNWDVHQYQQSGTEILRSIDEPGYWYLLVFQRDLLLPDASGAKSVMTAMFVKTGSEPDNHEADNRPEYFYACGSVRMRVVLTSESQDKVSAPSWRVRCVNDTCSWPLFTLDTMPLHLEAAASPKIKRIAFYSVDLFYPNEKWLGVTPFREQHFVPWYMEPDEEPFLTCPCTATENHGPLLPFEAFSFTVSDQLETDWDINLTANCQVDPRKSLAAIICGTENSLRNNAHLRQFTTVFDAHVACTVTPLNFEEDSRAGSCKGDLDMISVDEILDKRLWGGDIEVQVDTDDEATDDEATDDEY